MWRGKWTLVTIVLAAVVVRLIHIEQPFIDRWSWRQSDVAAIARNYLENGFHFSRPQIDWAGDAPGYVGTEFPILPFAASLTYKVTGVQEWVGRLQGVFFFAVALPFFFLLVRRVFGEVTAVWATFFYAFAPLSVVASRAFMPDVPSLSLAVVGVYFFLVWVDSVDDGNRRALIVSAVFISFSFLIKITAVVIGPVLLYLVVAGFWERVAVSKPLNKDGGWQTAAPWWALLARWELWLFALITLVPSAVWYWHAHRIAETSYPYHFFGSGGFRIMDAGWYWNIAKETVLSSLTPIPFVLAVFGAFIAPHEKCSRFFHWWFAAMLVFIFAAGWGNRHQWYQLPLVPIAAAFAGRACQWVAVQIRSRRGLLAVASVLLGAAFGVSSYLGARPFYGPASAGLRNLGLELKEATTPSALIIAVDGGDPTALYYAHRKGWHFLGDGVWQGNPTDSGQAIANLEKLRSRGATHLVFYAGTNWWLKSYREFAEHLATSATLVEETSEFTIYKLGPPTP